MTNGIASRQNAPSVRFYLPATPLRPLVTSYYIVDAPGPLVDFTHPEWGNVRFCLSGDFRVGEPHGRDMLPPPDSAIFGPANRSRRFETSGGTTLGFGLTPIGWLSLIASDASKAANKIQPLDDQLGEAGESIRQRLIAAPDDAARILILDAVMIARKPSRSRYFDAALKVQQALVEGSANQVADFVEVLGMEQRTVHRVCSTVFGFPPIQLLRRQRFLRTLAAVRDSLDKPLGQLIDQHYYDQAHFNRDFKAYMGMTPLAYFALPREVMRRAADQREAVIGAPVQGLHVPSN